MRTSIPAFVQQYEQIVAAAQQMIPGAARAQLDARTYARCFSSSTSGPVHDFTVSAITQDGMEFSTEYNDACNCHAEMQTATIYLAWQDIEPVLGEAWGQS